MEMSFLTLYTLTTFLFVICFINWQKPIDLILLVAMLAGALNELLGLLNFSFYSMSTNIYVVIFLSCWLFIMRHRSRARKIYFLLWIIFLLFSAASWYYSGLDSFSYENFVAGAMIYMVTFMFEGIYRLQKEEYAYFQSDDFLLTAAPLLFFISFSFLFSFQYGQLHDYVIFGMKLFDIISGFANIVFYSIINLYIYRQYRTRKTLTL